jgi:hypothetical protein
MRARAVVGVVQPPQALRLVPRPVLMLALQQVRLPSLLRLPLLPLRNLV